MPNLGLESEIVDREVYESTLRRFREAKVVLPTFAELADPRRIPASVVDALAAMDPDAPHALNLFRVHWYNGAGGARRVLIPDHLVLPPALTGVEAPIVVALGDRFPMIRAHKVLAAYGCLVPRIVTGQFDPSAHKAIWPSTGNYCRGGVAISRILGCRGVAVLPEGMSEERFRWLESWVADREDIIRTPGTESNVKEIYDKCAELSRDSRNVIFNQFREFGNYLVHYACTGPAMESLFENGSIESASERPRQPRLAAFVASSGSAGTLGAGDYLKERHGCRIVAAEALECPTLLYNGFGAHNIQGIGDKHVPFIHNVMNLDAVSAVSDRSTDALNVLFNSAAGRDYLMARKKLPPQLVQGLGSIGLSGICNVLAAIQTAKHFNLGQHDVILTVATDGAAMYATELEKTLARVFRGRFDEVSAGETFGEHLLGTSTGHFLELTSRDRARIFNLGYFTWVEQQGVTLEEFESRRGSDFWHSLRPLLPAWDAMIEDMNGRSGAVSVV